MISWTVQHATTVLLTVLAIAIFGTVSYISLPRESSPDIKIPLVLVTTPYPGASPSDIEGLVSNPLENELAGLKNIKKLESTSSEGVSIVSIEFETDVIIEDALQRTRDRVNRARANLPNDVDPSSVREISFSDMPVMLVTIAGNADQEVLKQLAEDLEDSVKRIPGVLSTSISGGLEREYQVLVDPGRLNHYGLGFNDILGALQNENVNIPGGSVSRNTDDLMLRVPRTFTNAQDIEGVAVKRVGDQPVFIRDLGRVTDGYASRNSYARMNGTPAVTLSITKRAGANIIEVADQVRADALGAAAAWPEGVNYRILADQSVDIRNMITELQNNIFTALLLVVTVLLFFMGARNSLFVALAIPLSMLISFAILDILGFTLNMVVLFSLILALGMLVDNAIVVVENIYRHLELGYSKTDAAIKGTKEVAIAIAASTATTIAAFFPMVFWGGIMGEFMGYLPKTVIIVLLSSLFVAVLILPVATSRLMRANSESKSSNPNAALRLEEGTLRYTVMMAYRRLLVFSIRYRYVSAALGVIALLFTFSVYYALNHGTELFANVEPNRARVQVQLPDGTELARTDEVTRKVESFIAANKNVDVWTAESGVSGDAFVGSNNTANAARITVDFLPHPTMAKPGERARIESTFDTIKTLRNQVSAIPGAQISVEKEEMGPPVGPDIELIVTGPNFIDVGTYVQKVKRDIAKIPGVTEVDDDYRVNRPEMALRTDRGAAKRVGVSSAVIGNTVRTAVAGTKATTVRERDKETDVIVQLAPEYRSDVQSILGLRLPGREDTSPDTFPVPLSAVASYELAGGTGAIRHVDQDLAVTIRADVPDDFNINQVQTDVADRIAQYSLKGSELTDLALPAGFNITMAGATDDQKETEAFLSWAFLVALALITVILVTQFDSLAMPLIILCTVVLSLIGVLWGLLITGTPFGIMMTGIGVISLAGIVVNNAIVLLDYVKQLRKGGMSVFDALVQAGMIRFRPVILTAITTILGLIPMAVGAALQISYTTIGPIPVPYIRLLLGGQSAGWWGPMAIAVIFGLAFATLLTLVMVPTLYSIFDDISRLPQRFRRAPVAATAIGLLCVCIGIPKAHSMTFEDAWRAAQENNLDIRQTAEQAHEAKTQHLLTWGYMGPTVQAHAGYTFNQYEASLDMGEAFTPLADVLPAGMELDFGEPIIIQPKRFFMGGLNISQPLLNAATTPALLSSARQLKATRFQIERNVQQIKAQVAQTYFRHLAAVEAEKISVQSLDVAKHQLALVTKQVTAELEPKRALIQAELRHAQASRQLLEVQAQRTQTENMFRMVIGVAPEDLSWTFEEKNTLPSALEEALETASLHRKDVTASAFHVSASKLQKTVMKLNWLPRIDGNLDVIYTENTGFVDEPFFWTAGIRATMPLWDGGTRLAQIRRASSQARIAEINQERTRQIAENEVKAAWANWISNQKAVSTVQHELALATEFFNLAQRSYTAGQGTWLELQEAELGLSQARFSALNVQVASELAAVQLLLALGTY